MEEPNVDIFVDYEDKTGKKTVIIDCPKSITYFNFKIVLKEKVLNDNITKYYIEIRDQKYSESELKKIINFENGDRVTVINTRVEEGFVFHKNPNINEEDMKTGPLTGYLKLILIKYISGFIDDVNVIKSEEIREIISELKKDMNLENSPKGPEDDIKSNLEDKNGKNINSLSNYVCSIIKDKDIDDLLNLVNKNMKNNIIKYWSILSKYERFNKDFQKSVSEAIENSYFDYSLINLSVYQQTKRNDYLQAMNNCPNLEKRYLFHGTQIDPISKIITNGFLYSRKPFYGMGIYFTDMLDYVAFYCGGTDFKTRRQFFGKVLPVDITFSCVCAEIYYSKGKLTNIYDFDKFINELDHFPTDDEVKYDFPEDQKVPLYGINFVRVEPNQGQVRNVKEIKEDKKKGRFIGNEYVITEKCQILPLYGLTFKRNEYLIIWRDPNFKDGNEFSSFLFSRKMFIYKLAKMNAYFESSTEKALELINKKKFNKIILITSIGQDLSGRKFVDIAREILGFKVVVLFFSQNKNHFSWLQNYKNALYTDNADFCEEYIMNYNSDGLKKLKSKIENQYKIKLQFTNDFLNFPKFIEQKEYKDIIFDEPNPNFKKVIIKNTKNNHVFCLNENGAFFYNADKLDIKAFVWYVTIVENRITLFSNGFYLGADLNYKYAKNSEYMERFFFEKINNSEYMFYYRDKSNVLTEDRIEALIQKPDPKNRANQVFKLVEQNIY